MHYFIGSFADRNAHADIILFIHLACNKTRHIYIFLTEVFFTELCQCAGGYQQHKMSTLFSVVANCLQV